jgi:hypothetical protein
MGDVEIAGRPGFFRADDKHRDLEFVQLVLVGELQHVAEHRRSRIAQGIRFSGVDQRLGGFLRELGANGAAASFSRLILGLIEDLAHTWAEHHAFDGADLLSTYLGKATGLGVAGQLGCFARAHESKPITTLWQRAKGFRLQD